ncbi:MAG: GtrA family protein [Spirochaetes bacterium]|nr:GtrA family protein [Spirochaetota bacterium]
MSFLKKIGSFLILEDNLKSLWRQYGVFFIVGVISFAFSVIFLRIFYKDLQMNLMAANVLSFILVSLINYLLSIRFVFLRGKFTVLKEMVFFYIIAILSLVMDSLLLIYLVDKMDIWYVFAKFITVFTVSFITFGLKKFWVFKK